MDNNRRTSNQDNVEELRRRLAARKAGVPMIDAPVRRSPSRATGRAWVCAPVIAVLVVAAIGFCVYRAGIVGERAPQTPEAPVEPTVQEPVVPVDMPDQTPDSLPEDQTPQTMPEDQQNQVQEPPVSVEPGEPEEPEVDHTGQKWAMLCDGTVVYENDSQPLGDIWPESVRGPSSYGSQLSGWLCPGGEGNIVGDVTLEYATHYGHEVPGGNTTRSVRWGSDVTVSEFLSGAGFSSFDEMRTGPNDHDRGLLPIVSDVKDAPSAIDSSKPLLAYKDGLFFTVLCDDCTGREITINGAPIYDLDAVIDVLGMPTCAVGRHGTPFVDPEYFDASEGHFRSYMWNMGKAGYLYINFGEDYHTFFISSGFDTMVQLG